MKNDFAGSDPTVKLLDNSSELESRFLTAQGRKYLKFYKDGFLVFSIILYPFE